MHLGTKLALFGSLLVMTACGQAPKPSSTSKIILGTNDLTYYTKDNRISGSIGVMAVGCTATHIGSGYVITAGHCVTTNYCTEDMDVYWSYLNSTKTAKSKSSCLEVVDHYLGDDIDYAVIRVSNPPATSLRLNASDRPQRGNPLTIYSHPSLRPLSWSGWCAVGEVGYQGSHFSYKCDTEGGSSGAAVLNKNYEIVGIHNFGSAANGLNAASYVADIATLRSLARSL